MSSDKVQFKKKHVCSWRNYHPPEDLFIQVAHEVYTTTQGGDSRADLVTERLRCVKGQPKKLLGTRQNIGYQMISHRYMVSVHMISQKLCEVFCFQAHHFFDLNQQKMTKDNRNEA